MKPTRQEVIAKAFKRILAQYPEITRTRDLDLENTPERVARAFEEMLSGYGELEGMTTFPVSAQDHGLVVEGPIEFSSMCSHHLLPFQGEMFIGYVPVFKLIGASKLPRIVGHYSRRLQLQERLTAQVNAKLYALVHPSTAIVFSRATHSCMSCRGVRSRSKMACTVVEPVAFAKEGHPVIAEFYNIVRLIDERRS